MKKFFTRVVRFVVGSIIVGVVLMILAVGSWLVLHQVSPDRAQYVDAWIQVRYQKVKTDIGKRRLNVQRQRGELDEANYKLADSELDFQLDRALDRQRQALIKISDPETRKRLEDERFNARFE